ncbi:MAG: Dabb family protein [Gemmataceae bacterium]
MRKRIVYGILLTLALAAVASRMARRYANARNFQEEARKNAEEQKKTTMLAHNVYFALKDNSAETRKKLVDACKKYLSNHPGEVFFAAGTRAEDLSREVNDRDFEVALHIVFKDKAAHDKYQEDKRHKQFIAENKDNWKKVRVFDSVVGK